MTSDGFAGVFCPIISMMPGTTQWECTSMVLTRRPPTVTCRRRPEPDCIAAAPTPVPATSAPARVAAACLQNVRRFNIVFLQ